MIGLEILTQNKKDMIKGPLAYNGKPKWDWIIHKENSSLTLMHEALLPTVVIDAHEERDGMVADIANAFI